MGYDQYGMFVKDFYITYGGRLASPSTVSSSFGERFSSELIFGHVKSEYRNVTTLIRTLQTVTHSSRHQLQRYMFDPGRYTDDMTSFNTLSGFKHILRLGKCYKYTWWSKVHVTTDTCQIHSRDSYYFPMPDYLWTKYKRYFPKTVRGSIGDLARGAPYSAYAKFIYAVRVSDPSKCHRCTGLYNTYTYQHWLTQLAKSSSIRGRDRPGLHWIPGDVSYFAIGNVVIDGSRGGCRICSRSGLNLLSLIGSTDCNPKIFSIGDMLMPREAKQTFESLVRAMILCRA